MYLMYVDESGDSGLPPPKGTSPTRYFCLTGLVVHEIYWAETLDELRRFRHRIKSRYGVYLDDELHASDMIGKPSRLPATLGQLKKHQRLAIIRHHADCITALSGIRLINVCVDKALPRATDSTQVFRLAWYALFQRFENTISRRNFPGPQHNDDRGIVFPDNTDGNKLRGFLDEMRMRNILTIKQRSGTRTVIDEPIKLLIEHPVCRDSRESYLIQAADCAAYLFKQSLQPNSYMKRHGGNAYFHTRLHPVLCRHASRDDGFGVVRL